MRSQEWQQSMPSPTSSTPDGVPGWSRSSLTENTEPEVSDVP